MAFATSYTHDQKTLSDNWLIKHNLNCKPVVQVFVDYEGTRQPIMPLDIIFTDDNNVRIVFSQTFTGQARLV